MGTDALDGLDTPPRTHTLPKLNRSWHAFFILITGNRQHEDAENSLINGMLAYAGQQVQAVQASPSGLNAASVASSFLAMSQG